MKNVSAANETRKPTTLSTTTAITSAAQVANARRDPDQSSISFALRLKLDATSPSESTTMAIPYQTGKNPGPGPSCPRYSQPEACAAMYAPSAPSASPDQKSALR